jgi:hypothetical protein
MPQFITDVSVIKAMERNSVRREYEIENRYKLERENSKILTKHVVFADNLVSIYLTFPLYLGCFGPFLRNMIMEETITAKISFSGWVA